MIIHIVSSGETIFSIANTYGVSIKRIITDNGLFGANNLVVGQALIILKPDIIHKVVLTDTLESISRLYNVRVEDIIRNNPSIILNEILYEGQEITIRYINQSDTPIDIYGFIYPFINNNLLKIQSTYSSTIAIFSYGFTLSGDLIEIYDVNNINTIKNNGAKSYMLLSAINEAGGFDTSKASSLFNNIELQNKVIDNILNVISQKGYDGLDLDFEYINGEDSQGYVDFINSITIRLNEIGKYVNVNLAPKTNDNQRGLLYEGHDYAKIGNVSNTVLLMTYEWGYTYSEPMAVSPINKIEEVVSYAISVIEPQKIYMGISNYGYDWKLPYVKGETKARSIGNQEAITIAQKYNSEIKFDNLSQTPYFNYTDESSILHEVWFEDVRSVKAKYDLINKYSLLGGGYWNLMRPFIQNWMYVNYNYKIN